MLIHPTYSPWRIDCLSASTLLSSQVLNDGGTSLGCFSLGNHGNLTLFVSSRFVRLRAPFRSRDLLGDSLFRTDCPSTTRTTTGDGEGDSASSVCSLIRVIARQLTAAAALPPSRLSRRTERAFTALRAVERRGGDHRLCRARPTHRPTRCGLLAGCMARYVE